jgi:hypothetical protein
VIIEYCITCLTPREAAGVSPGALHSPFERHHLSPSLGPLVLVISALSACHRSGACCAPAARKTADAGTNRPCLIRAVLTGDPYPASLAAGARIETLRLRAARQLGGSEPEQMR